MTAGPSVKIASATVVEVLIVLSPFVLLYGYILQYMNVNVKLAWLV